MSLLCGYGARSSRSSGSHISRTVRAASSMLGNNDRKCIVQGPTRSTMSSRGSAASMPWRIPLPASLRANTTSSCFNPTNTDRSGAAPNSPRPKSALGRVRPACPGISTSTTSVILRVCRECGSMRALASASTSGGSQSIGSSAVSPRVSKNRISSRRAGNPPERNFTALSVQAQRQGMSAYRVLAGWGT